MKLARYFLSRMRNKNSDCISHSDFPRSEMFVGVWRTGKFGSSPGRGFPRFVVSFRKLKSINLNDKLIAHLAFHFIDGTEFMFGLKF